MDGFIPALRDLYDIQKKLLSKILISEGSSERFNLAVNYMNEANYMVHKTIDVCDSKTNAYSIKAFASDITDKEAGIKYFKTKLREIRTEAGMSVPQLSKELSNYGIEGMSNSKISHLEVNTIRVFHTEPGKQTNKTRMYKDWDKVKEICEYFQVSMDDMLIPVNKGD